MTQTLPFPEINASLNGCATLLLTAGFVLIRKKKQAAHRLVMVSALLTSIIFLICYVAYHLQTGARTPFAGQGIWQMVYYVLLSTHVVLAMVIVPLVLRTFQLAMTGRFSQHYRWAKWTFPMWYYVSVTGVLVYFFLYQWFPAA